MNQSSVAGNLSEAEVIQHIPGEYLKLRKNAHTVEFTAEGNGWKPISHPLPSGIFHTCLYEVSFSP